MKYLVITTRTSRFDVSALPAHYEYLDRLRKDSKLACAGPFSDRSGGAYVLKAESYAEARGLAENDPLVSGGSSEIRMHEWDAR